MGYFDEAIRARDESESLEHHGILGQKWGVRRFESASGHLTPAGQARYNTVDGKYQKLQSAKSARRSAKTDYKFEKKIQKMDAEKEKILNKRAENREKIANKKTLAEKVYGMNAKVYDKLGNKTLASMNRAAANDAHKKNESKVQAKLKDFDEGTKYVKAGYERYNKVLDNYRHAKMGDLDKELAKSAKKDYIKQVLSDSYYGSKTMTALSYAGDAARKDIKAEKKAKYKAYSRAYDKWSDAQDKNDAAKRELDTLRKATGKTALTRTINVAKGKSAEAKAYSRAYDKWSSEQDRLDDEWRKVKSMR